MNFDPNTGQPINNNYQQPVVKKENSMAVVALVLAALGFNFVSLILGILALKKSKETNSGKGLSIAAIIISILQILVIIFIVAVGTMFTNLVWPSVKKEIVNQATCTMAYDCELNTKSEYICKYKDENNEEKEIKCLWTDVNENQYRTTTTQENNKIPEVVNEYIELSKKATDSNWKAVDYNDMWEKCTKLGDTGSFIDKNGNKIDYICKKVVSTYGNENYEAQADVTINDSYKFEFDVDCECGCEHIYTNGEYYYSHITGCGCDSDQELSIYDKNGEIVSAFNISECPLGEQMPLFIDNNVLYFVEEDYDNNKFNIYKMDFNVNDSKPEIIGTFDRK